MMVLKILKLTIPKANPCCETIEEMQLGVLFDELSLLLSLCKGKELVQLTCSRDAWHGVITFNKSSSHDRACSPEETSSDESPFKYRSFSTYITDYCC